MRSIHLSAEEMNGPNTRHPPWLQPSARRSDSVSTMRYIQLLQNPDTERVFEKSEAYPQRDLAKFC